MTDTELWSIKEVANAFKKHGIIQDQEPSGDLISKQAVIDAIKHAQFNFQIISTINFADYKKEVQEIVDNILSAQIKAINDLPSVNPQEPKTDVLDTIRTEIDAHRETLKSMADDDWYAGKLRGYDCDIEIIDKYKAESEVTDADSN